MHLYKRLLLGQVSASVDSTRWWCWAEDNQKEKSLEYTLAKVPEAASEEQYIDNNATFPS